MVNFSNALMANHLLFFNAEQINLYSTYERQPMTEEQRIKELEFNHSELYSL